MIAASDPVVKTAMKTFHGRIVNSLLGCAVGTTPVNDTDCNHRTFQLDCDKQ
jgi:hypothetical protein